MTEDHKIVLRERSTPDKLRYLSQKLVEIHDKLIDDASANHRGTLLGIAIHLDWMAQAAEAGSGPNLTPGFVNEPGSTSEVLPAEILAALDVPPYLSTACDTALRVEPADVPDATGWARRLHARCRLNNKFTGAPCPCNCHDKEA
ncbi:hypothetical protein OG301_39025 (plasmid) [Streptomyces platensis]|uniref:hypothetical protein n=1 Tax=Streptomyces platensis TaxID=58346 RepID=UPI002ED20C07|nr:hypothetical protein OG301_39025 [Streptomyces platensis]